MRKIFFLFTVLLAIISWESSLFGQHLLKHSVISNGSATLSSGKEVLTGTIGQSLIGSAQNEQQQIKVGFWYQSSTIITAVEKLAPAELPQQFRLEQNYPNPFNPTTTIRFSLPRAGRVNLAVYDMLGRIVAVIIDKNMPAGEYKVTFKAEDLPSGIYFYRLQAEGFTQMKKLTLLK